jgi:hypothetical protein
VAPIRCSTLATISQEPHRLSHQQPNVDDSAGTCDEQAFYSTASERLNRREGSPVALTGIVCVSRGVCQGRKLKCDFAGQISIPRRSHVHHLVCPLCPSPNSLTIDIGFVTAGAREHVLLLWRSFPTKRGAVQAKQSSGASALGHAVIMASSSISR